MMVYFEVHFFVGELWTFALMRRRARTLSWLRCRALVAEKGSGTFIIETPTIGWGIVRAWWTPEKVMALVPYPVSSEEDWNITFDKTWQSPDWDRWIWENYIDPEKGRACQLRVWRGRSLEEWINQTFPTS